MPVERIRFSLLDFKLGGRMLARYPGLTVVGGLAMAFAIWVGAGTFEFLNVDVVKRAITTGKPIAPKVEGRIKRLDVAQKSSSDCK